MLAAVSYQRQVEASAAVGPYTQTAAETHIQEVELADATYHKQVASVAVGTCTQTAAKTQLLVATFVAAPTQTHEVGAVVVEPYTQTAAKVQVPFVALLALPLSQRIQASQLLKAMAEEGVLVQAGTQSAFFALPQERHAVLAHALCWLALVYAEFEGPIPAFFAEPAPAAWELETHLPLGGDHATYPVWILTQNQSVAREHTFWWFAIPHLVATQTQALWTQTWALVFSQEKLFAHVPGQLGVPTQQVGTQDHWHPWATQPVWRTQARPVHQAEALTQIPQSGSSSRQVLPQVLEWDYAHHPVVQLAIAKYQKDSVAKAQQAL